MIYESQQSQNPSPPPSPNRSNYSSTKQNLFVLTDEQRSNLNKKLPRGFCLIKKEDYERLGIFKKPVADDIDYEPVKIEREIDLENPIYKTIKELWGKKQEEVRKSNRLALQTNFQGRSRQSEKIKNIIQRIRKLIKNTQAEGYLNRVGLMLGLNQIQAENKKGLLTIDTFKIRYMLILQAAKSNTFQSQVIIQLDQIIEQLLCYVEQARKTEFQNNIQSIQKSIDKITRYLSDNTDAKNQTQCNWYIRRKKKGERNDTYSDKQVLHLAELVKKLPIGYLVGIWEIVNEKPFVEAERKLETINFSYLDSKKMREIQVYVKSKLSQLYRSHQRKKEKIAEKKAQKLRKLKSEQPQPLEEQAPEKKNLELEVELKQIFGDEEMNEYRENNYDPLPSQKDLNRNPNQNQNQNPEPDEMKEKGEKNESGAVALIEDESSVPEDSSDSSMITDEDDSDF